MAQSIGRHSRLREGDLWYEGGTVLTVECDEVEVKFVLRRFLLVFGPHLHSSGRRNRQQQSTEGSAEVATGRRREDDLA